MRTVRSAARARNQPHPGLALVVWVLAVLLLALTARLATAEPARSVTSHREVASADTITDADAVSDVDADTDADTDAEAVTDAGAYVATASLYSALEAGALLDCFDDDDDDDDEALGDRRYDAERDDDEPGDGELSCDGELAFDDPGAGGPLTPPADVAELADNDDPIALEDVLVDEDAPADASSVIATEQREALRRRQRSRFGRVDVSLGWRRAATVRDVFDGRNELWLTATWRL